MGHSAWIRRPVLFLLLLPLLVAHSGCSRETPVYRYAAGQAVEYQMWVNQQARTDDPRAPAQRLNLHFTLRFEVESTGPEGARIRIRFRDANAALQNGEERKPLPMFSAIERATMTLVQAPDGRIVSLTHQGGDDPSLSGALENVKRALYEALPTLPSRWVKGNQWSRNVELPESNPVFGGKPSVTRTSFELMGADSGQGEEIDTLTVQFAIQMGSEEASILGKGSGNGRLFFDRRQGLFHGASYNTQVTLTSPGSSRPSQTIESSIEIKKL